MNEVHPDRPKKPIWLISHFDTSSAFRHMRLFGLLIAITALTPGLILVGDIEFEIQEIRLLQLVLGVALFLIPRMKDGFGASLATLAVSSIVCSVTVIQHGVKIGSNGLISLSSIPDYLLTFGFVLIYLCSFVLKEGGKWFGLGVLLATGGAMILSWMLIPRPPGHPEELFGLTRIDSRIPLVRALRYYTIAEAADLPPFFLIFWYGALFLLAAVCVRSIMFPFHKNKLANVLRARGINIVVFAVLCMYATIPIGNGIARSYVAIRNKAEPHLEEKTARSMKGRIIAEAFLREAEVFFPPCAFMGGALVSTACLLTVRRTGSSGKS